MTEHTETDTEEAQNADYGTGSNRVPPLNVTEDEAEYLWEVITEEIGKEEVWENGDDEVVRSLHTKIGQALGAFDEEVEA